MLRRLDAEALAPGGDKSRRPPMLIRPVILEDNVWIGFNASILKGVRISKGAVVGAGSVVTRDVPPHGLMVGAPARRIGWACRCGETLPVGARVRCGGCGDDYAVSAAAATLC